MIVQKLYNTGLIQFGAFTRHDVHTPVDLALELLASYPDLLAEMANACAERSAGRQISRLLATADAIPLGTALGLRLGIPLVYSSGNGVSPVDDLVGAYDIGHAALLVTNSLGFEPRIDALIAGARRVGLEVNAAACIVLCRQIALNGVEVLPLVRLDDVVTELEAAGEIPPGQARSVRVWLSG